MTRPAAIIAACIAALTVLGVVDVRDLVPLLFMPVGSFR